MWWKTATSSVYFTAVDETPEMKEQTPAFGPVNSGKRPVKKVILEYVVLLVVVIIFAKLVHLFIFQPYIIPTGSMEPTIRKNDRIIVSKYSYGLRSPFSGKRLTKGSELQRGDIVVFSSPFQDGNELVKRCIALPGETLEIKKRDVYINGKLLTEPYTYLFDSNPEVGARDNILPVVVPPGKYLFLGDNRDDSKDGRYFGFIEDDRIIGKAIFTFWPLKRFGSLK